MTLQPRYLNLQDDMTTDQRWYLDSPEGPGGEWLGTALTRSERYTGAVPLQARIHHHGPPLELTISQGTVPIVNERVAEIITQHAGAETQLVPLVVAGFEGKLWAVNTLVERDCLDEQRSGQASRFTEADGQPDRIGKYSLVVKPKIDPVRAGDHAIFRLKDCNSITIISGALADDLERAGVRCLLTPV